MEKEKKKRWVRKKEPQSLETRNKFEKKIKNLQIPTVIMQIPTVIMQIQKFGGFKFPREVHMQLRSHVS